MKISTFVMTGCLMLTLGVAGAVAADSPPGGQGGGYAGGQGGQGAGGPSLGGGRGGPREACRQDAQTFCKDIQPGGGRIKDCLEDHYKELSDACYDALKNAPPGPPPEQGGQRGGNGQGGGQRGGPQGGGMQGGQPSEMGGQGDDQRPGY